MITSYEVLYSIYIIRVNREVIFITSFTCCILVSKDRLINVIYKKLQVFFKQNTLLYLSASDDTIELFMGFFVKLFPSYPQRVDGLFQRTNFSVKSFCNFTLLYFFSLAKASYSANKL